MLICYIPPLKGTEIVWSLFICMPPYIPCCRCKQHVHPCTASMQAIGARDRQVKQLTEAVSGSLWMRVSFHLCPR